MVEILNSEILSKICRLCLKTENIFAANLLEEENNNNFNKISLSNRIFEFFAVKIGISDGLPKNICEKCLEFVNTVTEFRNNVRKCEARLQNYMASVGILGVSDLTKLLQPTKTAFEFNDTLPHDDEFLITIVDPNQDFYDYSNDSLGEIEYPKTSANMFPQQIQSQQNFEPATTIITNPIPESSIYLRNESNPMMAVTQPQLQMQQQIEQKIQESSIKIPDAEAEVQASIVQNVYLCQYCDFAFKTQFECVDHEEKHDQLNPYSCGICDFKCSERQVLMNHIKAVHQTDKPYICVFCKKSFGRRTDLKKHSIIHTGIRPFCCPLCPKSFSRNANLTKHLRIHGNVKLSDSQKSFKCVICNLMFTLKEKLIQHKQIAHPESYQNLTSDQMLNPQTIVNNPNQQLNMLHDQNFSAVTANPEIIQPNFSNGFSANQLNIQNPLLQQSQIQTTTQPKQKSRRRKIEICTICAKAFPRKRELQRHMAIHINELQFACSYCSKKFNRKEKLIRHERSHLEKFTCSLCNLTFLKQDSLNAHIKTHQVNKLDEPTNAGSQQQSFLTSLQQGFRPQLNFYSELTPEDAKITTPF